jgi:hypothetical protein
MNKLTVYPDGLDFGPMCFIGDPYKITWKKGPYPALDSLDYLATYGATLEEIRAVYKALHELNPDLKAQLLGDLNGPIRSASAIILSLDYLDRITAVNSN